VANLDFFLKPWRKCLRRVAPVPWQAARGSCRDTDQEDPGQGAVLCCAYRVD
jgi:hypothetical protein